MHGGTTLHADPGVHQFAPRKWLDLDNPGRPTGLSAPETGHFAWQAIDLPAFLASDQKRLQVTPEHQKGPVVIDLEKPFPIPLLDRPHMSTHTLSNFLR
jgi:hypothetical protein